ncbi:apolipoprotein A-I-like [Watersipora subatra]|uniref:apolipoprotein A-I-like n=1 Tax=Watersipora subatra TaxID=2589382 RepID=UPI00355B2A0E
MKFAAVILAVAIVGAFAQDATTPVGPPPFVCTSSNSFVCTFQKLGHTISYHAKKLGGKLAGVGQNVLDSALSQGGSLLANAGNAVLKTVLEHMNTEGLLGKRALLDGVKEHFTQGVDKLKQLKEKLQENFKKAVAKLTGMIADQGSLKKIEDDAENKVDGIIAEFNKENKKGFLSMASTIASKIRDIFQAGMSKLRERFGKKVDERAILGFDSIGDAWNAAKQKLADFAGSVSDTFQPHIDSLKTGIAALGAQAKEHAGKLVDAAKGSFNDLKNKLTTHIESLKGQAGQLGTHATNALNALKEAVTSIAAQALANAKGTLNDAVKTGTDAAGVITDHLAGVLGGN